MGKIYFCIACCLILLGCHSDAGKKPIDTAQSPIENTAAAVPADKSPTDKSPTDKSPTDKSPTDKCPADPIFGGTKMDTAQVVFLDAKDKPFIVAEIAQTDSERERGLMYRTHLTKNGGMLFLPDGPPRVQVFWMKNTCIPLDMLFIDEGGKVVGILEDVPPLNLEQRTVNLPSSYVLEVNAGWCRAAGVKAGQRVKLPKI